MKVLVDSSVWIDHLRRNEPELVELLETGRVVVQASVIGELACGALRERDRVLDNLRHLPTLPGPGLEEALYLIRQGRLWGRGLGWTDVILLASCRLGGARLWTRDRALGTAATELDLRYAPPSSA